MGINDVVMNRSRVLEVVGGVEGRVGDELVVAAAVAVAATTSAAVDIYYPPSPSPPFF